MTNPNSVTVAYTSSDSEKATIDASSGVITLVGAGNTTISAVFEGNDTYEAQTVTYTLTVNAAPEPPAPTTYSITLSQEGEYCHGSWSGDVEAGTICSLTPESGYSFDQTATGTILLASSEQAQLSFDSDKGTVDFEMPAEAVTITVTVYQIRNAISYEGTAAEHVTGQANGAGGEEIVIIPNEGYTLDEESQSATPIGIRAFDASDENVELEVTVDTGNNIASFTMPAYAVRVTADIVVP